MLNKDEIEDIKDNLRTLHKVLWNEHKEGTYTIERILEYINCLEQKESILDKVTELIKSDIKTNMENEETNTDGMKEYWRGCIDTEAEILEFIEGEKK